MCRQNVVQKWGIIDFLGTGRGGWQGGGDVDYLDMVTDEYFKALTYLNNILTVIHNIYCILFN